MPEKNNCPAERLYKNAPFGMGSKQKRNRDRKNVKRGSAEDQAKTARPTSPPSPKT